MTGTTPLEVDSVRRFRSNGERVAFMVGGVVGVVVSGPLVATGSLLYLVMIPLGLLVFLEGLRAEIVVDLEEGTISSQGAIRRWEGRIEDIESIRVPPWGPIALMLRSGAIKVGGGLWPGQVLTCVFADRRGSEGRAYKLAECLGVEVSSVWPQIRPSYRYSEDDPLRGVRLDLFKSPSGILKWIALAACLSIVSVIVIVAITGT